MVFNLGSVNASGTLQVQVVSIFRTTAHTRMNKGSLKLEEENCSNSETKPVRVFEAQNQMQNDPSDC